MKILSNEEYVNLNDRSNIGEQCIKILSDNVESNPFIYMEKIILARPIVEIENLRKNKWYYVRNIGVNDPGWIELMNEEGVLIRYDYDNFEVIYCYQ